MKDLQTKEKFIELRAQGLSFEKISTDRWSQSSLQ